MLDSNSLKNSTGLVELLAAKDISLTTVDATPLSHIVAACDAVCSKVDDLDQAIETVAVTARNEDHDGTIYELSDLAAQSVLSTQALLRSKVLPHIRKIIETVEADAVESRQTGLPYELEYRDIPYLLTVEPTQRLIEQFASADQFESKEDVSVGSYDLDRLLELAKYTNDSDFNDLLKTYLVENPDAVNQISGLLAGTSYLANVDSPVTLLAVMVVCQNITGDEANIPVDLNISLSSFRYRLLWLTVGAAKQLLSVINRWSNDVKNRVLYADVVRKDKIIVVNKSVFTKLATDHGLTIESLIGNELLGRPYTGHSLTTEDALIKTKQKYDVELSMASRRNELENDLTYTQSIFKAVMQDARDRSVDEETLAVLGDTKESMLARAKLACERLYASGVSGKVRDHLVASLVCAIYYAHTDALMYLSIMGDVSKSNPELTPEQVMLIARVEFVAWYVYKQMAIIKTE